MMRTLKNCILILMLLFSFKAIAQTDKATTIKIINDKNFVFVATSAIPMNSTDINAVFSKMNGNIASGSINLAGNNYDLKIMPDSIIAYLPYYGRSFSAPIGRDESGIKFTTTDFTYAAKKNKKGWQITINTASTKDNPTIFLSVSQNGYASLTVISNQKQTITYNGYIAAPKESN